MCWPSLLQPGNDEWHKMISFQNTDYALETTVVIVVQSQISAQTYRCLLMLLHSNIYLLGHKTQSSYIRIVYFSHLFRSLMYTQMPVPIYTVTSLIIICSWNLHIWTGSFHWKELEQCEKQESCIHAIELLCPKHMIVGRHLCKQINGEQISW